MESGLGVLERHERRLDDIRRYRLLLSVPEAAPAAEPAGLPPDEPTQANMDVEPWAPWGDQPGFNPTKQGA